jgi:2-methylcitrate dehydratase PrpD
MATTERTLAAFVADLQPADVPDDVRDRAGLTVADTVGAVVGGSTDDAVRGLARRWARAMPGTATVFGADDWQMVPHFAAFCNGTAGTVLELDEGHRYAAGHPAIHVLPALLADTEVTYASSDALFGGLVAGYEAAVRVARAMAPLADGYHPHGVWGAVGGAAAVSHARGLDASTTETAMAIAANYAQHTLFAAATEGATVRNSYAGMSNLAALVAVDQAGAGFTGLRNGVSRHLALAAADGVDETALVEGLGERWELADGYFKRHAACRYTHPVLDALTTLEVDLDPEDIEAVTVETYPAAARLTERRPETELGAKFSIPFAAATALTTGGTSPEAFRAAGITAETLALADRVTVSVDDEFAARAPDRRGARVTVETADGTLTREVAAARGGDHDPFSEAELEAKFHTLVDPVVGADRAEDLWASARSLDPPRVLCTLARR